MALFGDGGGLRFGPPDRAGLERLRAGLARAPEAHVFLLSRLDRALRREGEDGQVHLLRDPEGEIRGGAYVGRDRNLAVSTLPRAARPLLARLVRERHRGLLIAVSPEAEVAALVRGLGRETRPLLHRRQALYAARRGEPLGPAAPDLERPEPGDLETLAEMALGLAGEDLGIPPARLDAGVVARTAARRLERGRTFVIRREGRPVFKIEVGVAGPEAALVEGVYTFPRYRGRGLAGAGTAALLALLLRDHPLVALHVAAGNLPARRAYERAGMRPAGSLGLALFRPWR